MHKKIKLLVVIRHPVGGIRTYLKYTYKYLDSGKYDLTILTVRNPEGNHIKYDLKKFTPEIIEVGSHASELNLIKSLFALLSSRSYDLIHSQGFTAGILTAFGNSIFRVPHVITSHDVIRKDQFSPSLLGSLKKSIFGHLLGGADVIQSVSYDAEENLLEYFPFLAQKRLKLKVILNGIDLTTFSAPMGQDNSLKDELGIDTNSSVFGFLGRFMPQKGFEYIVDAVQILSNDPNYRKFKVLAVNDGAYAREYKALVNSRGLSDYFLFYGFVPDVKRILIGIDALIMPSLWEACPLQPMESFVSGCPVIASNCIGLREVVKDTPAVVVENRDSASLAEAIKMYIDMSGPVKERTRNFVPFARQRFDSKRTAASLDSLFRDVITSRSSSPVPEEK